MTWISEKNPHLGLGFPTYRVVDHDLGVQLVQGGGGPTGETYVSVIPIRDGTVEGLRKEKPLSQVLARRDCRNWNEAVDRLAFPDAPSGVRSLCTWVVLSGGKDAGVPSKLDSVEQARQIYGDALPIYGVLSGEPQIDTYFTVDLSFFDNLLRQRGSKK